MAIIRRRQQAEAERGLARTRGWDPLEVMQDLMRWDPFREMSRRIAGDVFKADLPGVKESDLDISVTGNRLTISGERQEEKKDEGDQYYTYERNYGSFSRSFTLPEGVDVEHVQAELKDGVLNVVVPKKPEVQPKRIPLKTEKGGEKAKA